MLSVPGVVFGYMTAGGLYYWFMDRVVTEPRTRQRIFGVSYNIGALLFGGTAPFLGTMFVDLWGSLFGSIAIGGWSSTMALISLICYLWNRHRLRSEFEHFHSEIMKSNSPRVSAVDMGIHGINGLDFNGSNEDITENTEFIIPPLPPIQPPMVTMRSKHHIPMEIGTNHLTIPAIPDGMVSHEEQISTVEHNYFDQMKAELNTSPDYALKV